MKQYYDITNIAEGIYKIAERGYAEHANMFLFLGKGKDLLIDCGLGVVDIKAFLKEQGVGNVIVTVTHAHFDHIGGLKFFDPSEIIVPAYTYKNLHTKELWGLEHLKIQDFDEECLEHYAGETVAHLIEDHSMSLPVVRPHTGSSIPAGGYSFDIIEAPGHTDDSVIFFDRTRRILITGDVLYDGKMYIGFPNSNTKDYLRTLEMIEKLDFELVLPGHNKPMNRTEALEVIERWKEELLRTV